jgi:cytochrome c
MKSSWAVGLGSWAAILPGCMASLYATCSARSPVRRPKTHGPWPRTLLAVAALLLLPACRRDFDYSKEAMAMTGGDPDQGRKLIQAYGCGSCHVIPGIPGAKSSVGPSLAAIASQSYVGGVVQHTPENLIRWIQDPQRIDSLSAMPNLGLTESQARHVAAYLYKVQ